MAHRIVARLLVGLIAMRLQGSLATLYNGDNKFHGVPRHESSDEALSLLSSSQVLRVGVSHGLDTQAPAKLPLVANTWAVNGFEVAADVAWDVLARGGGRLDAIEAGCAYCEDAQCDGSVGYGGSPDELGETTLDAMIMDGETMDVGAVANLRRIKQAITVARFVMNSTTHTLLAGKAATKFAKQMGLNETSLTTEHSRAMFEQWEKVGCQPNYWRRGAVHPDPTASCGPYEPARNAPGVALTRAEGKHAQLGDHDTIGMVVVDADGRIASGTSTNGASHKVHGRVGDSPVMGAGSFARKGHGACGATGDGDQMMRLLPCYQAVESLANGMSPLVAAQDAIRRIKSFYPHFAGAIVVANQHGDHAGACAGFSSWSYTYRQGDMQHHAVAAVECDAS